MNRDIFEIMYNTEETYWWFTGQRLLLKQLLDKYYSGRKNLVLLDVGCGTGRVLELLGKYGKPYGIDLSDDALGFCRERGAKNVKSSDVMDIKFKPNTFDAVTSLGVFYHRNVVDDLRGMKEIHRVLKPDGRLLFFDCAMMSLYGNHDLAFHGVRRYSKRELKSKLENAGFVVERISYINSLMFLPVYLKRKLEKLTKPRAKSEIQETISPLFNSILGRLYKTEIKFSKYMSYPFGINIFAVARKSK